MDYTAPMAAINGTFTVTVATVASAKDALYIYVSSDAVFSDIRINGQAANVRANYLDSVSGEVPAGTLISAGFAAGNYFSSVTLVSGVITFILK